MENKEIERYERKFLIDNKKKFIIKKKLNLFEIFRSRKISNIYLDNPKRKNFIDNVDGENNRMKFRIRYYDNNFSSLNFEIKKKINNVVKKKQILFSGDKKDIQSTDGIKKLIKYLVLNYKLPSFLLNYQPSSINEYKREYFLHKLNKNIRITFDTKVGSKLILGRNVYFNNLKYLNKFMIIECKYNTKLDEEVRKLKIHNLAKFSKFSKYSLPYDFRNYL
tara:strand:- start:150 stop:812 length:663 start_codon:yes stop_codon:yes gene_type:complete